MRHLIREQLQNTILEKIKKRLLGKEYIDAPKKSKAFIYDIIYTYNMYCVNMYGHVNDTFNAPFISIKSKIYDEFELFGINHSDVVISIDNEHVERMYEKHKHHQKGKLHENIEEKIFNHMNKRLLYKIYKNDIIEAFIYKISHNADEIFVDCYFTMLVDDEAPVMGAIGLEKEIRSEIYNYGITPDDYFIYIDGYKKTRREFNKLAHAHGIGG
jgi:hypothetical protein